MVQHTAQLTTSFRTTTPYTATTGRMTTKQFNPVQVYPETSHKALLEHCMHVHQPTVQVCKPGESLALRKVRSVDEITAKLPGMTVFTIVDFKKGYWMVVLHPDSRKLTCMVLPFGRFQWT